MKYELNELNNFTKEELIKHITNLYEELAKHEKPKNRIILTNTSDVVKRYIKEMEVNRNE